MAPSLKRTLLLWLLLPLLAIVPAAAALQYWLVLQPTREAFDQALANSTASVASFVRLDGDAVAFDMNPQAERSLRTDQFDSIYYAVLAPDGQQVAGDPPLREPRVVLAADAVAFFEAEIDGATVRVAARGVACGASVCQVRVGETQVKRQQIFRKSFLGTLAGVFAFALASVATIVLATRQALRPLLRLGEQVGTRSLDDLRPVDAAGLPAEVIGLVDAVNRLFGRVREGSLAQQAFLADAAHQLRTPLASLKNEAELALAAPHPSSMQGTLDRLNAGASRAARLSSQLLALARSDASAQLGMSTEALDLKAIAAEAAAEWVPLALAAGLDLGFELESAPLAGRRFLLREMLANLLHNAVEHAGPGAHVTVRTRREDQTLVLEVEDDGPGIPEPERSAAFDRFVRGHQAAGVGSGLGLAIVRDIAAGHGGSVTIVDPPTGRGVILRVSFADGAGR